MLRQADEEAIDEEAIIVCGTMNSSLQEANMLWTIFVILLVLWALGLISGYTMGGVLHILLVIALVVIAVQVLQGRRLM